MRIKIVTLALLSLAAAALPVGAAQAQAKIGVVNVQRLLQEAPQAQAASQALENEFANRRRDLENQQRDLKAKEDKLAKDGAVMAEAERRNAEKALRDGQRELARKQNEFLEDLNVRRNEALGQLQRTVLQEVQTYAKSAGLDVVVADALYASQSVAVASVWPEAHVGSDEKVCPLEPLAPHLTEVAPHPEGSFRDAVRHRLGLCEHLAFLRFDGLLALVSAPAVITQFSRWSQTRETVSTVVFVASHLSRLSANQAGILLQIVREVRARGYRVAMCSLSDQVYEVLARTGVADAIGPDKLFATQERALQMIYAEAHLGFGEAACPLLEAVPAAGIRPGP